MLQAARGSILLSRAFHKHCIKHRVQVACGPHLIFCGFCGLSECRAFAVCAGSRFSFEGSKLVTCRTGCLAVPSTAIGGS